MVYSERKAKMKKTETVLSGIEIVTVENTMKGFRLFQEVCSCWCAINLSLVSILIISIFISSLVGCAPYLNHDNNVVSLKYFQTTLSKEKWKWGYGGKNQQQEINEYVPLNESVEKWTELVTEQYIFQFDKKLLSKYVAIIKEQLRANSKDFQWRIIEENDDSIVYEWSHQGSGIYPPTYEVAKLFAVNGGLYRIAYDKYTKEMDDDAKKWRTSIKNAKIK